MGLLNWIKINIFRRKEPEKEVLDSSHYAKVVLNPIAKSKGINDDYNKIIEIYKNGELIESRPYTKQMLEAVKKVDEIPIYEEAYEDDEEFEFDPFENQDFIKYKK